MAMKIDEIHVVVEAGIHRPYPGRGISLFVVAIQKRDQVGNGRDKIDADRAEEIGG